MSYIELNKKFKDIEYVRPDYKTIKTELKKYVNIIKNAKSAKEVIDAYYQIEDISINCDTMTTLAGVRATLDTTDSYYEEEDLNNNKESAAIYLIIKKINQAILESPYKEDMRNEFGDVLIQKIESSQKLICPEIVKNITKIKKSCQKYDKVMSQCKTNFRGEECNFYGLLKHMESTDRSERKEAFISWANLYESISDKLDCIYDELIEARCDSAKKLGFNNFIDNAYLELGRFDYNKDDVKIFREQVKKYVVPVANQLFMDQKKRLGIDQLHWYDESLIYPEGNANPIGTKNELVKKAKEMYKELSKETGKYFDYMCKHDLFDLDTRPGKCMGGYCTFLSTYKAPFIFANFNGTSSDVDTLTHEAGHAFQAYTASRNIKLDSLTWAGYETSEIHSMSMELFTYPWMEKFFGSNTNKYLYGHLANNCSMNIPYLVAVDEFQHKIFENPTMTAMDRRKVWHQIEKDYMPWRDYDGNQFLSEGGFWMQKQHIFLDPFYYIDYAIAQTCAFQLFLQSRKNREDAWNNYMTLCKLGGSKGYKELLSLAHIKNPLEEGTLKEVIEEIYKVITDFSKNIQ